MLTFVLKCPRDEMGWRIDVLPSSTHLLLSSISFQCKGCCLLFAEKTCSDGPVVKWFVKLSCLLGALLTIPVKNLLL